MRPVSRPLRGQLSSLLMKFDVVLTLFLTSRKTTVRGSMSILLYFIDLEFELGLLVKTRSMSLVFGILKNACAPVLAHLQVKPGTGVWPCKAAHACPARGPCYCRDNPWSSTPSRQPDKLTSFYLSLRSFTRY